MSHPDFGRRQDVQGIGSSSWQAHSFLNSYQEKKYDSFHIAKLALTDDPPHERDDMRVQIGDEYPWASGFASMNGFVANYASNPRVPSDAYPEVMGFYTPDEVPISAFLRTIS